MKLSLYYVARRYNDYEGGDKLLYVAGPFGHYAEALDAKRNSVYTSDYLDIVEQEVKVKIS